MRASLFPFIVLAAISGGCGDSSAPQQQSQGNGIAERGIYISSNDCIADGKLTADQCATLVDGALSDHEVKAPKYQSLVSCARAQGPDRCEKTFNGTFSPKLQAYFFVMSKEAPTAIPLYPTSGGEIGFRTPSKQIIDLRSDHLSVSAAAQALAYENSRLATTDSDYAKAGASAVDIK